MAVISNSVGTVKSSNNLDTVIKSLFVANTDPAISKVQSIMLAPKMFPIPISGLSNFTDVIVVTSSGILVPTAIITKLTTPLFMPSISLMVSTLLTSTIAPSPIASAETTNSKIILYHGVCSDSTIVDLSFFASKMFNITKPAKKTSKITPSMGVSLPSSPKNSNTITQAQK